MTRKAKSKPDYPAVPAPKKGGRAKVTIDDIEQALTKSGGIISAAAALLSQAKSEALGKPFSITRQSVSERIKNNPRLTQAREQCSESALDLAELELMRLIRDGNITAIIFYLKCKGKSRGFVEKNVTEISGHDGGPVTLDAPKIDLSRLEKEDLTALDEILEKLDG